MARVAKVLCIGLWVILIGLQPAASIVNRKRNTTSKFQMHFYPRREAFKRKSYLEPNRPLWVLEDKVTRPGDIDVPIPRRAYRSKRKFISPASSSIRLPSHYVNFSPATKRTTDPRTMPRNHKHFKKYDIFPVFDDYGSDSESILVYRGAKARMIYNTMMSSKKYPMQEPVPGQILYPPYSPKFKPTPVVKKVRSEGPGNVFHNVTLIPFYAHEAIDPRRHLHKELVDFLADESGANDEMEDNDLEPTIDRKNRYHSFYSQGEVQKKLWSVPFITTPAPELTTPTGLPRQITTPNAVYKNHRMEETTTPIPDSPFRITYESENNKFKAQKQKRYRSVLSAKYGGFKTFYPIFTLNKLLRYKPLKSQVDEVDVKKPKPTSPEEKWLKWNSRTNAAHKSNYLNSISQKDMPKNHKPSSILR